MNYFEITAQVIGIIAMTFNILSYQQKTQKGVITFLLFGNTLFSVNFFMLGAVSGGIMNLVGIVRSIIFMNREKLHADKILWQIGFTAIYLISYILTFTCFGVDFNYYNGILEFLPVIGTTVTTISFRLNAAKSIRRFGLISSPLWLIYNISNFAVGAIIGEVLSLISIIIGIIRFDIKKESNSLYNEVL